VRQLALGRRRAQGRAAGRQADLGGERHGPYFQTLHRGRRSLTLKLKAPEGRDTLPRLVREPTGWWKTFGRT
jgi:crotonobetainyl-CoA:carnitine CoA-transferase CaiB-like acyl-CoA transferase